MADKALRLLPHSNKPRDAGNWPEGQYPPAFLRAEGLFPITANQVRPVSAGFIEKNGVEARVSGYIHRKNAPAL
jgi:hypothetical protein